MIRAAKRRVARRTEEQREVVVAEEEGGQSVWEGGNCRMESDEAAVCGNNRVYFSRSDVSKGSHGRRENETKV